MIYIIDQYNSANSLVLAGTTIKLSIIDKKVRFSNFPPQNLPEAQTSTAVAYKKESDTKMMPEPIGLKTAPTGH